MNQLKEKQVSAWLLGLNGAGVFFTWVLIMWGGLVHGTGASLACPDWPTCYGSFFPEMSGLVFYEHGHRLLGASVGFCTLLMVPFYWRTGIGRLRFLSLLALGLVIFQGVLGGITVIFRLPPAVSISHLGTSMAFLALLLWLLLTAWQTRKGTLSISKPSKIMPTWVLGFSLFTLALVYLQLVSGAVMRHLGAGLACVDWPLCRGSLWPESNSYLIPLHMIHRLGAGFVGIVVLLHGFLLWPRLSQSTGMTRSIKVWLLLSMLVIPIQITLGFLSVATALAVIPTALHLGFGALLWLSLVAVYFHERQAAQLYSIHQGSSNMISPSVAKVTG